MKWSLHNEKGFLPPLKFSNGKTQEDIVNEVLESIHQGHKIIFIKGVCGSGKSAIALNIIRELGRGSVVVPVKSLQSQYTDDYTKGLFLFTKNNEKMKIKTIMGRKNFKCAYAGGLANNPELPCTIELKEKNKALLQNYIKENPLIDGDTLEPEEIGRFNVAPACPYWNQLIPRDNSDKFKNFGGCKVVSYDAVSKQKYFLHQRKLGCGFYEQYRAYVDADAIIFNSKMYEIENVMGRKPVTDVEIIDECDKFLDDLGDERKINLDYLSITLSQLASLTSGDKKSELIELNTQVLRAKDEAMINIDAIIPLEKSKVGEIVKEFIENEDLKEFEELKRFLETSLVFKSLLDETYLRYSLENSYVVATLVTVNLKQRLQDFLDKNKVFVMMSGTVHSESVLKDIFGIKNFKIIEAETKPPGRVKAKLTSLERNFRYSEFAKGNVTRKDYLMALEKSINDSEKPALVQVNGILDLPTQHEKEKYDLTIKTQVELLEERRMYQKGELMQRFKEGKIEILYGTVFNRGIDLPGKICNSIILTKYPYPSVNSLFWKILKKRNEREFHKFYFDKAEREFLQRIYRGLRSVNDKITILSPDSRCFTELQRNFQGQFA